AQEAAPYTAYMQAWARWDNARQVEERFARYDAERTARAQQATFETRLQEGRAQYPDWDAALTQAATRGLKVSEGMRAAIPTSPHAADLVHYLATHPEECLQLAEESVETPVAAATVMRRLLESQVNPRAAAPRPVVSQARPRVKPVGSSPVVSDAPPGDEASAAEHARYWNRKLKVPGTRYRPPPRARDTPRGVTDGEYLHYPDVGPQGRRAGRREHAEVRGQHRTLVRRQVQGGRGPGRLHRERPAPAALPHDQGPGLPGAAHQRCDRARDAHRPGEYRDVVVDRRRDGGCRGCAAPLRQSGRRATRQHDRLRRPDAHDAARGALGGHAGDAADRAPDVHDRRREDDARRRADGRALRVPRSDPHGEPDPGHLDAVQSLGVDQRELPRRAVRAQPARDRRVVSGPEPLPPHHGQLHELDAARAGREPDRLDPHRQRLGGGRDAERGRCVHGGERVRGQPAELPLDRGAPAVCRHGDHRGRGWRDDDPDQSADHPDRQPAERLPPPPA